MTRKSRKLKRQGRQKTKKKDRAIRKILAELDGPTLIEWQGTPAPPKKRAAKRQESPTQYRCPYCRTLNDCSGFLPGDDARCGSCDRVFEIPHLYLAETHSARSPEVQREYGEPHMRQTQNIRNPKENPSHPIRVEMESPISDTQPRPAEVAASCDDQPTNEANDGNISAANTPPVKSPGPLTFRCSRCQWPLSWSEDVVDDFRFCCNCQSYTKCPALPKEDGDVYKQQESFVIRSIVAVFCASATLLYLSDRIQELVTLPLLMAHPFVLVGVGFLASKVFRWLNPAAITRRENADAKELEKQRLLEAKRKTLKQYWENLAPLEFEQELANLYRCLGYEAETTKRSGDGGVDIFLRRGTETTVVQCKQHKRSIGPHAIRELYGVVVHMRATKGILACPAGFSEAVHDFVIGKPLELLDMGGILAISEKAVESPIKPSRAVTQPFRPNARNSGANAHKTAGLFPMDLPSHLNIPHSALIQPPNHPAANRPVRSFPSSSLRRRGPFR